MSLYTDNRASMRSGDLILCWGKRGVQTAGEILSAAIEVLTARAGKLGPSHALLVCQPYFPATGAEVLGIECTLTGACNGVRSIYLTDLITEYEPGSIIRWYPVSADSRRDMNMDAFYAACASLDGVRYSVPALLWFLLPSTLGEQVAPNPDVFKAGVCSMSAAYILAESVRTCKGLRYQDMTPAMLADLADKGRPGGPIFDAGVEIFG